jgi:hypothetical protein
MIIGYNSSMMAPINDEGKSMTCQQLLWQVRGWDIEYRLKEKYHTWKLKYSLPKVYAKVCRFLKHSID